VEPAHFGSSNRAQKSGYARALETKPEWFAKDSTFTSWYKTTSNARTRPTERKELM
jgi:hypothetical protein